MNPVGLVDFLSRDNRFSLQDREVERLNDTRKALGETNKMLTDANIRIVNTEERVAELFIALNETRKRLNFDTKVIVDLQEKIAKINSKLGLP